MATKQIKETLDKIIKICKDTLSEYVSKFDNDKTKQQILETLSSNLNKLFKLKILKFYQIEITNDDNNIGIVNINVTLNNNKIYKIKFIITKTRIEAHLS